MLMCIQNLVRFCQAILKIMNGNKNVGRTEGQNNGTTEGQGESSIAPTFSKRGYNYQKISSEIFRFILPKTSLYIALAYFVMYTASSFTTYSI